MTHSASSVIRSRVLPNSLRQSSHGDSALRGRDLSLSRPFPKAREATHFVSRVLSEQRRYCEVGATNMYFAGSTNSQSISMARTVIATIKPRPLRSRRRPNLAFLGDDVPAA